MNKKRLRNSSMRCGNVPTALFTIMSENKIKDKVTYLIQPVFCHDVPGERCSVTDDNTNMR